MGPRMHGAATLALLILGACGSSTTSGTSGTTAASTGGSSSGASGSTGQTSSSVASSGTSGAQTTGAVTTGAAATSASSTSGTTAGTSTSSTAGTTGTASTGAATSSSSTSSSTTGSSTTGATLPGHESWGWVYTNYTGSLAAIAAHPASFTHISPDLYTVNYAYSSGVAYYSNCSPAQAGGCGDSGTDDFDGLTSLQIASQLNALGLATVPLIYGGAGNDGVDIGVQNILNDAHGEQTAFITAMVAEAVAKGYAGYNLDWEVGSGVDSTYAQSFVNFVNAFKTALAVHGMSLSADAVASNINGTYCSSDDGYLDFGLLSTSMLDRLIIEDYTASYGTAYSACQSVVLSQANPVDCPLNTAATDVTFTGLLNFMCTNLPAGMVVIGLESNSSGTNGFAGTAFSTLESYGIDKVALWPQAEGSYPYLSDQSIAPTSADWFALLASFLST